MKRNSTLVSNYEKATHKQIRRIEGVGHYFDLFHSVIPNNFSLVCIHNKIALDVYKNKYSDSLRKLNVANYNLFYFCKIQFKEVNWTHLVTSKQVDYAMQKWGNLIKAGNSFLCFQYANFVIKAFLQANYPIIQILHQDKYRVIVDTFKNVEYWVKSFFKLNVYLDFNLFYDCFADFLEYLVRNPVLFDSIEKVEVAKEFFPQENRDTALFPVMSLVFNHQEAVNHQNLDIRQITESVNQIFGIEDRTEELNSLKYLERMGANISLSQGYKSYKQYLALIEALDDVYDAKSNYAYLKAR